MAWIILKQAAIMLLLNLVGIIAYRTKIVDKNGGRQFSSFVLEIVTPVLVVNAYSEVEYEFRLVVNMLWTFLIAAISYVVAITAAYLLIRRKAGRETEIERFSVIYSNCGFMGIPLASALLGNEGVFYATAFLTIFFCFAWTHGIMLLTGQHDRRALLKKFCSPTMIGIAIGLVLFFCRIQLPGILQTTFDYVAGLNTPMAMVASGISVAQANLLQAVRTPRVYYVSAVKLLGIPLLLTLLFLPLSFIPMEVRTVVLVLMAAPSAAMCTLQCQKHSMNDVYASDIFAMTTILSMAAMPAVVKLFTTLLELVSA
ncbi:AEC family transporter [uncultured Ruminococcus sp.]|uniref:AEC family transporter n=1 Tax=uncultured Ruminococcus sp. TaxID=165186 RepID=UPI00265DA554|nr:AEC family transporter [uncultured Ruminococcus sp.]